MSKPFFLTEQMFHERRYRPEDMQEALGIPEEESIYAVHPPDEEYPVWRVTTVSEATEQDLDKED